MRAAEYPSRIALADALEIVRARCAAHRMADERVELAGAHRRVLAEDVRARHDLPPFANSAMDGFALRGVDLPADKITVECLTLGVYGSRVDHLQDIGDRRRLSDRLFEDPFRVARFKPLADHPLWQRAERFSPDGT